MNVLICGAGLVGSYAACGLVQHGHSVTLTDIAPNHRYIRKIAGKAVTIETLALEDRVSLTNLFSRGKFKIVVFAAGRMRRQMEQDPWQGFVANVVGVAATIEESLKYEVERFIFCSSLGVYDFSRNESEINEDAPLGPGELYDETKCIAERWLQARTANTTLQSIILRFSGIYGPGLFQGGAWMGSALQEVLQRARQKQREVCLSAELLGSNEYLYIKDAAQAIIKAVGANNSLPRVLICNIGPGQVSSSTDLAQALKVHFPDTRVLAHGTTILPKYLLRQGALNIERAKTFLGYVPDFRDLCSGIGDYVRELQCLEMGLGSVNLTEHSV